MPAIPSSPDANSLRKLPDEPAWLPRVSAFLDQVAALLPGLPEASRAAFETAYARWRSGAWTVMVSGLRSVGKSSFVCALWGDSELLPTAVRDCTQSNTVVRIPRPDETDRSLLLDYLPRDRAQEFATRGLAFYRIAQVLDETLGPTGPRLDEGTSEEKLRRAIAAVHQLFKQRRDLAVLYEPVTEQLEQLEEFLAFLETPEYLPGRTAGVDWQRREEFLSGLRRADGRPMGLGKLLALRAVEVIRASPTWPVLAPRLVDTPWVPKFHNARRAELVVEQAREADVVVVVALPELYEPEEWLQAVLTEQPEIGARTLMVFNQIDTIDPLSLYRREGFAELFQKNTETLAKLKVPAENLCISCARRAFLQGGAQTADVADRLRRLEKILGDVRKAAENRTDSPIKSPLLKAVASADGGLSALRNRLATLYRTTVLKRRASEALTQISELDTVHVPASIRDGMVPLKRQAMQLLLTVGAWR